MSVEEDLTRLLACWAAGSALVGGVLGTIPATRRFGRQTFAWGVVDGAIAYAGIRKRASAGPTDTRRLRRILLLNAGADVGYLVAAVALLRRSRWRGDALAVLLQGGFLLALDGGFAYRLRACDGRPTHD